MNHNQLFKNLMLVKFLFNQMIIEIEILYSFGINFMLNKLEMIKSISVKLKMLIPSLVNYNFNLATRNLIN